MLEIENTYQIYLTKKHSDKVIGTDVNIGKTIAAIIKSFFRNKNNILTYICDINDKHQAARDRKFKIWFNRYAEINSFELFPAEIQVDECSYYIAVIVSKEYGDIGKVRDVFNSKVQELKSKIGGI